MAGIKDVAKAAGVSVSTVSNALNGKKNVGEETRKRILQICKELSYYPNLAGKMLKTRDNKTILFVFSDFDRNFYLQIIKGIHDYTSSRGYDFMICTNQSCDKFMRNHMTSGCIMLDMSITNDTICEVAASDYPIVVLDRVVEHSYVKSIVVNNYDPMCELTQGMIDRGYRRFAFLGGPEQTDDTSERYGGFVDTLEKNHISFNSKNYFSGDYREKSGHTVAKILMLSERLPEALMCANDNMAVGAIKTFRENGIRVPEDIAVTGFDDSGMAELMGVTTVEVPDYERGYLAAQALIESLKGKKTGEPFRISTKVKWRDSVLEKRK